MADENDEKLVPGNTPEKDGTNEKGAEEGKTPQPDTERKDSAQGSDPGAGNDA